MAANRTRFARYGDAMTRAPTWTVLGVPIDSVGRGGGTEEAPNALRETGLVGALGARDAGDLDVRVHGEERDPETGIVGADDVLEMTATVRTAVRALLDNGERPLLLGGCCSLLPGALAGARDHAPAQPLGLAYVDGHVDIYDGDTSPTGEAADMPVGVALGREPAAWTAAAGGASIGPAAVVVLGARDRGEAADIGPLLMGDLDDLDVLGPDVLRAVGLRATGADTAERLGDEVGRFWLHLDLDVLDEEAMPATDYLMPGGLQWAELAELLAPLGASDALIGVSLGCLNPEKDPDGSHTKRTADLLAAALR